MIEAVIRLIFGGAPVPFAAPKFLAGFVEYGPILMTKYRLARALVTTALVLVRSGRSLPTRRTAASFAPAARDPEMVGLLGINLPLVFTGVFGIGCLLAGLGGVLAAPLWTVTPSMAAGAIMPAFVIVTIGGLGSYRRRHRRRPARRRRRPRMTIQFQPECVGRGDVRPDGAILLIRPRGLFGERWERFE